MSELKTIDWNQASDLGLMERINREILHPLGLAMSRNPETGFSESLIVADDGIWEYHKDLPTKVLSDDKVKTLLAEMINNV